MFSTNNGTPYKIYPFVEKFSPTEYSRWWFKIVSKFINEHFFRVVPDRDFKKTTSHLCNVELRTFVLILINVPKSRFVSSSLKVMKDLCFAVVSYLIKFRWSQIFCHIFIPALKRNPLARHLYKFKIVANRNKYFLRYAVASFHRRKMVVKSN